MQLLWASFLHLCDTLYFNAIKIYLSVKKFKLSSVETLAVNNNHFYLFLASLT